MEKEFRPSSPRWREAQLESFAASLRKRSAKFLPPPSHRGGGRTQIAHRAVVVFPSSRRGLYQPPQHAPTSGGRGKGATFIDLKLAAQLTSPAPPRAPHAGSAPPRSAMRCERAHIARSNRFDGAGQERLKRRRYLRRMLDG